MIGVLVLYDSCDAYHDLLILQVFVNNRDDT